MAWTYRCLNRTCSAQYNVSVNRPRCPKCKSTKARWLPMAVAVGKVSASIDRDARQLASSYGMTDYRSAYRGEARKQLSEHTGATIPVAPAGGHYGQVALPVDRNGMIGTANLPYNGATCSTTGIGSKFSTQAGQVIPGGQAGSMRLKQMTKTIKTGGQEDHATLQRLLTT
jgi:hypothetical protein